MLRILEYHITEKEQGQQIKQFLKNKGFSTRNLIELKNRPDAVILNGAQAFMNRQVCDGDFLRLKIEDPEPSEKIPPVRLPLDIVYEDEDILVINKPAGMPIHPSMQNYDNTVANALAWYFSSRDIPFVFRCINRLDRDTSGLTLIAKHSVSAGILSGMIHRDSNGIRREYLAICRGPVTPAQGCITAPISRSRVDKSFSTLAPHRTVRAPFTHTALHSNIHF